jgi:NADPH:quinone reductase-like Zn-dependent oxidoreductase
MGITSGKKPLVFPLILGSEACGTLEDGTEVVLYPVMGDPFYRGDITLDPNRHFIGEEIQGTLAEYIIVPRENAIPRPKELPTLSAAVLGVAWLTAYRMLFTRSGIRAGQKMLVQGSSGGVATALIQLGAAASMQVWTTGRTAEKRELALKLGAKRTFLPGEELPEQVDVVFDMSGKSTFAHSLRSVKLGGTVVTSGIHSGGIVPLELMRVFVDQVDVRGCYAGTLDEFQNLLSFVAVKGIVPHIGQVLPMEKAPEGLKNLKEGKTMGKIVLTF